MRVSYPRRIGRELQFEIFPNHYYVSLLCAGVLAYVGEAKALTPSRLYAQAFPVSRPLRVDRIAANVQVPQADQTMRLGIYKSDGEAYPKDLLVDAGIIDISTEGTKILNIDETLEPGLYFTAFINVAPTATFLSHLYFLPVIGHPSTTDLQAIGWNVGAAFGPLPDPYPAVADITTRLYSIALRISELLT